MKKNSIILTSILICGAAFFIYRNPILILSFGPKSRCSSAFTCKICGSTKNTDTKYLLGYIPLNTIENIKYKAIGFSACTHKWKSGISRAIPDPVPDGNVVLVRGYGKYGAFILYNQLTVPEQAEYEWWYQSNGSGKLDKSLKTVSTGRGITPKIKFMDFEISWSGNTKGQGWIYYKHSPGDKTSQDGLHFCITNLKSVQGINLADSKWEYKATPAD